MKTVQVPDDVYCVFLERCDDCPYLEIKVHDALIYGDNVLVKKELIINCEHYEACKRFQYKEESK